MFVKKEQMELLTIRNLSKTYSNGVKALQNVNLDIPKGMYGLLGPNGAGKSTLMRTIATLQTADSGEVTFEGLDVLKDHDEVRKILGYLPQEFGLYPKVTAEVLLDHFGSLRGISKKKDRQELVRAVLEKTNLYSDRKKKLGGYSGGMKRRFGIAQAILSNPKLLIVDEPTAGLDPMERNRFHNLLSELAENAVIILSTHIVEDVKELCAKTAIINKGKVLVQGNPDEMIDELRGKVYFKSVEKKDLSEYRGNYRVIADRLKAGKPMIHIYSENNPGNGFVLVNPDLEDVYFSMIFE